MKKIKNIIFIVASVAVLAACNKAPMDPVPNTPPPTGSTPTLATLLDDPNYSILKSAVVKAGLSASLGNPNLRFTLFAPDNAAFIASGFPQAAIDAAPVSTVTALISYHIVPQVINSSSIPQTFPNFQYPSIFNPAPQISPLFRLTTFPSRRNGDWVNNIPVIGVDAPAVNGVMHKMARVVAPPSEPLWNRIENDTDLEFFEAAIKRADNGTPTLEGALKNVGANFTVFAPTDAAFVTLLTNAIAQALIAQGVPAPDALNQAAALAATPDVFTNPNVTPVLTAETVKGIVVYHILGVRAFSNNIFTTATAVPTLLNGAVPAHPGVTLKAEFNGLTVTNFTAKGAANASESNIDLNLANHNQHYLNGVLHKIDQVLLPQ